MSSSAPVTFRPIVYQPVHSELIVIGTVPTQLMTTRNQTDYIQTFIVSIDAAAAGNVFLGDQAVTTANGIEIVAGAGPAEFRINDERQQYELMWPLLIIQQTLECKGLPVPFMIPIEVWDMTQWYGVAAAATNLRLMVFRTQFV